MTTRVLVINDTQEILELFREILTDEGYEYIGFSYTIQNMDEIERLDPDLIILDCMFGEEKPGWQMLQKLKMRRSTAKIPVVLCTHAVETVRDIEGYLLAKGIAVVLKPFDIEELLLAVSTALESRQFSAKLIEDQKPGEKMDSAPEDS